MAFKDKWGDTYCSMYPGEYPLLVFEHLSEVFLEIMLLYEIKEFGYLKKL